MGSGSGSSLSLSVSEIDSVNVIVMPPALSVADVQAMEGESKFLSPPEEREVSAESRLRAGLEITDSIITSSANNSPKGRGEGFV